MPQPMKDLLSAPIPLSVVIFLIAQTMAFVWWGSDKVNAVSARISSIEMGVNQLSKSQEGSSSHESRIIVLEQKWTRISDDLSEIKGILRQKNGQPQP